LYLEEGFLLPNKGPGIGQPSTLHNVTVLVANTSMDTDKIKIYGSRVQVDSIDKVAAIEYVEKNKMKQKVDKFYYIMIRRLLLIVILLLLMIAILPQMNLLRKQKLIVLLIDNQFIIIQNHYLQQQV
jgi:hypothetical protein